MRTDTQTDRQTDRHDNRNTSSTYRERSNETSRRPSSSVTLHGRPAGGFTRAGQAMRTITTYVYRRLAASARNLSFPILVVEH